VLVAYGAHMITLRAAAVSRQCKVLLPLTYTGPGDYSLVPYGRSADFTATVVCGHA
jgi:hypothetical protein